LRRPGAFHFEMLTRVMPIQFFSTEELVEQYVEINDHPP
jgi:hypothetical protein